MLHRDECLTILARHRGDAIVVTTMGTAIPWHRISNTIYDIPSVGSAMGHAADFALGIALAHADRPVWCFNGDGSMLMTLETLVTARRSPAPNYVLYVFQNDTYEVTGNQPTPGAGQVSFPDLARAAGFASVFEFQTAEALNAGLAAALKAPGPIFVNLRVEPGQEKAPSRSRSLADDIQELRRALRAEMTNP